jgi:hypothetical protein
VDVIEADGLGKCDGRKCRILNVRWGHDREVA